LIVDVWAQPSFVARPDRLSMPEVRALAEKSGATDRIGARIGPDELVAEMDTAGWTWCCCLRLPAGRS
jgi:hypothetical protein